MEHSFDRLETLFFELGVNDESLLIVFSNMINKLYSKFNDVLDTIFILDNEDKGKKRLKSLTDVSPLAYVDEDELFLKVRKCYGGIYGNHEHYGLRSLIKAAWHTGVLKLYRDGLHLTLNDKSLERGDLKLLAYIYNNYLLASGDIYCDGDGLTFDEWESFEFRFDEFDYMGFDFNFLEQIN